MEWNFDDALRARGEEEYEEGLTKGRAEGEAKGRELTLLATIKNVANNAKTSIEEAMTIMGIPADERPRYAKMLES